MRVLVLLAFAVILGVPAAHAGCPKVKVIDDPFGGTQSRTINTTLGWVESKGGTLTLKSGLTMGGASGVEIPSGFQFELKMADDSTVTLNTLATSVPTSQATQYGVYTSWNFQYGITLEQLEKLATVDTTATRSKPVLNPDSPEYAVNVMSAKQKKKIRATMTCALEMAKG